MNKFITISCGSASVKETNLDPKTLAYPEHSPRKILRHARKPRSLSFLILFYSYLAHFFCNSLHFPC
uniref:Uncharacterized protein n=1 Tax=Anguilla anguilla TaxID=7936 RepID=A0A0E9W899_ANGAN